MLFRSDAALAAIADRIDAEADAILAANAEDMAEGRASGLTSASLDRLELNDKRIEGMAEAVEIVRDLADPVGKVTESWTRPNGMTIERVRVPIGVIGIAAPERHPLLGFVSLAAPAIATGNTVVAVPSETHPLAVTDLYQVLETSDLPGGVVNIVTGHRDELAKVLAEHDDVEGIWYWGSREGVKAVELASAHNMKRTWCHARAVDWASAEHGEGREFLREASQVKNIWIPYGE